MADDGSRREFFLLARKKLIVLNPRIEYLLAGSIHLLISEALGLKVTIEGFLALHPLFVTIEERARQIETQLLLELLDLDHIAEVIRGTVSVRVGHDALVEGICHGLNLLPGSLLL